MTIAMTEPIINTARLSTPHPVRRRKVLLLRYARSTHLLLAFLLNLNNKSAEWVDRSRCSRQQEDSGSTRWLYRFPQRFKYINLRTRSPQRETRARMSQMQRRSWT